MSALTIVTNGRPRELLARYELPEIAQDDFDYIYADDAWSPRIVKYRGCYYDVNEFTRTPPSDPARLEINGLELWDGYQSDSYFSGVVIRYTHDDYEHVIVGRYWC